MYKTYYICHHCANYISFNKSDIEKHYQNLTRCKSMDLYLYDEAHELSVSRKFYLEKESINNLNLHQIIMNYSEDNMIQKKKEIKELSKKIIIDKSIDLILFIPEIKKYKCKKCLSEFKNKKIAENHLLNYQQCEKISIINKKIIQNK